jgi:hypothetical protein
VGSGQGQCAECLQGRLSGLVGSALALRPKGRELEPALSVKPSRNSLGQAVHSRLLRSTQIPTIRWMRSEYQLRLGVRCSLRQQEQLNRKDQFRERHGCSHRRLPAVDTCCLPCVNVELDLRDDVVVDLN